MKIKITDQDPDRHNHIEYPMEIGGQKFEPVKIEKEKDRMLSVAQLSAQQEYDRIMESVAVLQQQAQALQRRMQLTEMVHAAKFSFVPIPGKQYWLAEDIKKSHVILTPMGPNDWSCSAPDEYNYVAQVRCLGDQTWQEIISPL